MQSDIKDFNSLVELISSQLKVAMLAKQELELETLRMLKAAIKNYQIELGSTDKDLTLDQAFGLLRKEVKKREQVAEEYAKANRNDLADKELKEAAIIGEFLPAELNDEELGTLIKTAIVDLDIKSINQIKDLFDYLEKNSNKAFSRTKVSQLLKETLQ